MASSKIGHVVVGVVLAGGIASGIFLSGGGHLSGSMDGGTVDGGTLKPEPKEVDFADRVIKTAAGKYVQVSGANVAAEATVKDSDLGRVVEIPTVSQQMVCNAVLEAKIKNYEKTDPRGGKYVWTGPDVPALVTEFGVASMPVLIEGSCSGDTCFWSMILQGPACKTVGDLPQYVGSTMHEFVKLAQAKKDRFLRREGTCTCKDPKGKDFQCGCLVAAGDPRAKPDSPIFVPHAWAGRTDINYVQADKDGKPGKRWKDAPDFTVGVGSIGDE